ncbi:hypothetical protein BDV96DRAFT_604486 [Lophiotrema nucula]|uniref:Uncharacterized protein n=1 Tax=Lophiotrema nucula TaxID=690887 RepID=A0A6A5YSX5_9PLEO|nr:hypothetical protein BDV96DRAFT_604486 [Lophiotrema nucula]
MSSIEKSDKPFNWQRPTTSYPGQNVLELQCFHCLDYVEHYAAIVATYLALQQRSPAICMEPLVESNLKNVGVIDIAVLGYVGGLSRFTSGAWQEEDNKEKFAYQTLTMPNGCKVAFIGPFLLLVVVAWSTGRQYPGRTPPRNAKTWLEDKKGSFDWVDPEIGHMAQASLEGHTSFGHLHLVSDNIAHKYPHDLSNELLRQVLQSRKRLVGEIEDLLDEFFLSWDSCHSCSLERLVLRELYLAYL